MAGLKAGVVRRDWRLYSAPEDGLAFCFRVAVQQILYAEFWIEVFE